MVDDEALIPAVEVLMGVDLHAQLLQQSLVRPLSHRVHGGTHVIQDAHDTRGILGKEINRNYIFACRNGADANTEENSRTRRVAPGTLDLISKCLSMFPN